MPRKQTYPLLWFNYRHTRLRILNKVVPKPVRAPVICKCNHCFDIKLSAKIKIYFNLQNISMKIISNSRCF